MPESHDAPVELLQRYLRADSPRRELSISNTVVVLAGVSRVGVAVLPAVEKSPVGQRILSDVAALLTALLVYQLVNQALLRTGRYRPALSWVNAIVESSFSMGAVWVSLANGGPIVAMLSPGLVIGAAVIVMSAIRMNALLCVTVGLVAGLEFSAIYVFGVWPTVSVVPFGGANVGSGFARAFSYFAAGGMGALISKHLLKRAEEALRSVREQDLMGKYLLHERLGEGGMAEVFRATYCPEGGFKKSVAIKRVLPSLACNPEFTELFKEEARLCAMLSHPNVVQVTDCGRFQDTFILAMEFVDGVTLHQLLRRGAGPLPLPVVTYVAAELAAALHYIHGRIGEDGEPLGLVHRDLNPANVLISRFGEVKLADFGVAHAAMRVAIRPDTFYGKVPYAAPEQLEAADLDGRADLFALGLTIHEMVTGQRAIRGTDLEAMKVVRSRELPPPSAWRPEVPPRLDALVGHLLRLRREDRPADAGEVRAAFSQLTGELAPFPTGPVLLTGLVQAAQGVVRAVQKAPSEASTVTHALETRTRDLPGPTRRE